MCILARFGTCTAAPISQVAILLLFWLLGSVRPWKLGVVMDVISGVCYTRVVVLQMLVKGRLSRLIGCHGHDPGRQTCREDCIGDSDAISMKGNDVGCRLEVPRPGKDEVGSGMVWKVASNRNAVLFRVSQERLLSDRGFLASISPRQSF